MESQDVPLSAALRDEKKAQFISKEKISLAFCNITRIDRVPYPFNKVEKLHISHNKISTLDGIEQFQHLEQLSLSHNRIENLDEFYKVSNRHRLKELSVRGNPLAAHPDYINRLIEIFPNVFRIDDLVVEPEDRKFLIDYERISVLIIPFYMSIQRDIETATRCLNRLSEIQQSGTQLNENMTHKTSRRGNLLANDPDGAKILDELKTSLSHPELLSALNLNQKMDLNSAINISSDRGPLYVLRRIVALITSLYPAFEHIEEEDSDVLYEAYKTIFNEIMVQYHGQYDNSFDIFLTNQVLQNRNYDLERFSNDSVYAFECILLEFYKLMPSQAFMTENIIANSKSSDKFKANSRYLKEGSTKISPLDVTTTDPNYLKTVWLGHFPIFPLNKQYLLNLYTVLRTHVFFLESTCSEFFEAFDKVYGVQNNETEAMTLGSLRANPRMAESQIGFSTRDSAGFIAEDGTMQGQQLIGTTKGAKQQMIGTLPEEKSVLPLLLFVKLSDKTNALKSRFLEQLKQSFPPSRIVRYKKKQADKQMVRINEIQNLLLKHQIRTKKRFFDALKLSGKSKLRKADVFYQKNLYLKSIYSILKVIAEKRGALKKILNELDGRLYYQKKIHFTKWKLLTKAVSFVKDKGAYISGGKNVKFAGDGTADDNSRIFIHSLAEGSRTSRGSRKAFESWEDHQIGYISHRSIFRKCPACDTLPNLAHKLL